MRGIAGLASAGTLAAILVCATPSPVSACTSSQPSFAEAVRGAGAIARVTVVEGWDGYQDDPTHSETYRVDRVLKGSLPELVTVAPAWTTLCRDSVVGYFGGDEGAVIIVAFDVPYYDQTIHPMWAFDRKQGVSGSAGVPSGMSTLAGLEAAIRSELGMPDTATAESTADHSLPLLPCVLAAAGGLVLAVRRLSRRSRRTAANGP